MSEKTKFERKLLKKYRRRIEKLKARVARQRYRILQNTMSRLEIAWNNSHNQTLMGPMSRLHKRMVACRKQQASGQKKCSQTEK